LNEIGLTEFAKRQRLVGRAKVTVLALICAMPPQIRSIDSFRPVPVWVLYAAAHFDRSGTEGRAAPVISAANALLRAGYECQPRRRPK